MVRLLCYCDDCQAAAKQIDALPNGHSGLLPDGGTTSAIYRKDRVQCVSGAELLIDHKLRPTSPTIRVLASCCNSYVFSRYENWYPIVTLHTHSPSDGIEPEFCMYTKCAPDPRAIRSDLPRHPGLAPRVALKVAGAALLLALQRLPLQSGSRVY